MSHDLKPSREINIVKLTRGDLVYADIHFLAKLIQYGQADEKEAAEFEWEKRIGKPFPYHPSYDDDTWMSG